MREKICLNGMKHELLQVKTKPHSDIIEYNFYKISF